MPYSKDPQKGYFDLTALSFKDDGTNGWTLTTVNGFIYLTATSTNALKQVIAIVHPNHNLDLGLATAASGAFFHLHWTHATVSPTGVIIITVKARAGKPNQGFVTLTPLVFTLTPTAGNIDSNTITELAVPADWYPYLTVDAIWNILIERNRGANAGDTFANPCYLFAADLHVLGSGKMTTAKDIGTGWVNT